MKKLKLSVDELNLSTRAMACLRNAGIETIGDLVKKHPRELLKEPNLGKTTLGVIEIALAEMDLKLGKKAKRRNAQTNGLDSSFFQGPLDLTIHGMDTLTRPERINAIALQCACACLLPIEVNILDQKTGLQIKRMVWALANEFKDYIREPETK